MHDVHGAIDALKTITGLPDLALGSDGHTEIVFGETTPVGFVAVDRFHLELVAPLPMLGLDLDRASLARLMTANYLGAATGASRLALDPARGEIVLCQRTDVRDLDEDSLPDLIGGFLRAVEFWNGDAGREALAGESGAAAESFADAPFALRA